MIGFFVHSPKAGEKDVRWTMVRLTVVSIVFCIIFLAGCKKRESVPQAPVLENVYTNRAHDAAYLHALDQNWHDQLKQAASVRSTVAAMTAYRNQIKATLSDGTNEVVLAAALAKDPKWSDLKARYEAAKQSESQTQAAARAMVQQALMKEAKAQADVAEGKARPLDAKK